MSSRSEYPAPFMKKDSFKAMRENSLKLERESSMKSERDSSSKSDYMASARATPESPSGLERSGSFNMERSGSFHMERSGSLKLEPTRPELHPIDEDELQRKELERLLGTATDEDRKDMIKKALSALDASDSTNLMSPSRASNVIQTLHPSAHAHLFSGTKVPVDTAVRGRPVSAQKRRPSVTGLLGSIPENRTIMHEGVGKTTEIEIMQDDISDICSSSYDPKYPPKNLFSTIRLKSTTSSAAAAASLASPSKSSSGKHNRFWIPTGLSPQFLLIQMHMTWKIKKVEVRCSGVETVTVRIEGGLELGKRTVLTTSMNKLDDRLFLLNEIDLQSAGESMEVTGNKIAFTFQSNGSSEFVVVLGLSIHVLPTG